MTPCQELQLALCSELERRLDIFVCSTLKYLVEEEAWLISHPPDTSVLLRTVANLLPLIHPTTVV